MSRFLSTLKPVLLVLAGALSLTACGPGADRSTPAKRLPVVAVANFGAHPIIDVTIDAFKKRMNELGYVDGENVTLLWKSVEGDLNILPQMVDSIIAAGPDVAVSITTPVSQALVKRAKGKVPVVFCGVTDPVGAGLVPSWDNEPGSGVTGTSDRWPYREQLQLIRELVPNAQKIGVPYNSGESNSQYALGQVRPLAEEMGLEVVTAVATNVGEVRRAVDSLLNRGVDAIYTGSDNTVMAGFQSILKVAHERKVPVIVGESANVERGGLATYSVDYRELGRGTADLVDEVLRGQAPGTIPVLTFPGTQLFINLEAAEAMGVEVPASLLEKAQIVHTSESGD